MYAPTCWKRLFLVLHLNQKVLQKKHQVGFVNAFGYQPVYVLVHWACYPRGVFALSINLGCSLYKYFVKIRSMLLCSPVMYHTYIRRIRKRAIPCSSSQSDGFTKKTKGRCFVNAFPLSSRLSTRSLLFERRFLVIRQIGALSVQIFYKNMVKQ